MYNISFEEEKIIKFLTKKEGTFEELKSIQNISAIKMNEILQGLENKNIVDSVRKHELVTSKGKKYTRINQIYFLHPTMLQLIGRKQV